MLSIGTSFTQSSPGETSPLLHSNKQDRYTYCQDQLRHRLNSPADSDSYHNEFQSEEPSNDASPVPNAGGNSSGLDKTSERQLFPPLSVSLLNNGSVARDHLASERTFLAYVRTSLGIASAGVALTQFLKMGSHSHKFSSPLGAITIFLALMVLFIGTKRFFRTQTALQTGYYPAARLSIVLISFLLTTIITSTFAVILFDRIRGR